MPLSSSSPSARSFRRVPCSFAVVLESSAEEIDATAVDISEKGIRLSLDRAPRVSPRFKLIFRSGTVFEMMEIEVGMIWITPTKDKTKYLAGFSFLKISKEDHLRISEFIHDVLK